MEMEGPKGEMTTTRTQTAFVIHKDKEEKGREFGLQYRYGAGAAGDVKSFFPTCFASR